MKNKVLLISLMGAFTLTACATAPEPEVETVIIPPVPVQTCTPISKLEKVVIPAETETYYAITEIENPPYEPITRTQEMTRVVKEAETIYVNKDGEQVTDICEEQVEDGGAEADTSS